MKISTNAIFRISEVFGLPTSLPRTFAGESIRFKGEIPVDIWANGCGNLSLASLLSLIDALKDYSGTVITKRVYLGAKNKAKLTAAQLAIVTDKGWILG